MIELTEKCIATENITIDIRMYDFKTMIYF